MSGITRTFTRYWADGPNYVNTYYACHHNPDDPRRTVPDDHPRTISVREDHLLEAVRDFFAQHVFGPDRKDLLAATMPPTADDDRQHREQQAAALRKRLRQIDTAENAQAREIETLAHLDDPHAPALTALRARIVARFTEFEGERTQVNAQLADLDKTEPQAGDPSLLDKLPMLGDILKGAPPRLHQELYQAFDLQVLYKKNMHQVTINVTITDSTLQALAAIIRLAGGDPGTAASTPPDPAQAHFSDLEQPPMTRERAIRTADDCKLDTSSSVA
jgi:site-specific DNA recombinase